MNTQVCTTVLNAACVDLLKPRDRAAGAPLGTDGGRFDGGFTGGNGETHWVFSPKKMEEQPEVTSQKSQLLELFFSIHRHLENFNELL